MRRHLKLTDEQRALAEKYQQFARHLVAPWKERFPSLADDLTSSALLGLCQAAGSFDPARGVKFGTFAALRINGELRDELRRQAPKGFRTRPDDAPQIGSLSRDHTALLLDTAPPVELVAERLDEAETILARLPALDRRAVVLLFVEGVSRAVAARILRVSRCRIEAALRQARAVA